MGENGMKILIINAWGGNRGDEAMLNSLFALIKEHYPSAVVDMMMFRDETVDVNCEIRQIKNRIGVYYYSFLTPGFRILNKLMDKIRLPFRSNTQNITLKCISFFGFIDMRFLKNYDYIISAPQGPTISDIYNVKDKTLYPLEYARRFKVPYFILGVSMGPFEKKSPHQNKVYKTLAGAEKILVRENISLDFVKSTYPELVNVDIAIDLVFAEKVNTSGKMAVLTQVDIKSHLYKKPLIGACISMTPARDPRNAFNKDEYVQKMKAFFEYVADKTGGHIVLFPHLNFDMPYLKDVFNGCPNNSVSILPPAFDSDLQQSLMHSLDFFISSRYHPTIFSIKAGIPSMVILNQFKTKGMLEEIGLNIPFCWQDETLEEFKTIFDECWLRRDQIRVDVENSLVIAQKKAEKFKSVLKSFK
jgi:polysaccharide pyruvyl transferase WcaK-like protein